MTRFNSINPLQNTATLYKKHLAGWQTTQKGKKYKEITSLKKKLISFPFQSSTGSFAIQQGVVCTMWPYSQRAH